MTVMEKIRSSTVDLVLLDVQFPPSDGLEVLKEVALNTMNTSAYIFAILAIVYIASGTELQERRVRAHDAHEGEVPG